MGITAGDGNGQCRSLIAIIGGNGCQLGGGQRSIHLDARLGDRAATAVVRDINAGTMQQRQNLGNRRRRLDSLEHRPGPRDMGGGHRGAIVAVELSTGNRRVNINARGKQIDHVMHVRERGNCVIICCRAHRDGRGDAAGAAQRIREIFIAGGDDRRDVNRAQVVDGSLGRGLFTVTGGLVIIFTTA